MLRYTYMLTWLLPLLVVACAPIPRDPFLPGRLPSKTRTAAVSGSSTAVLIIPKKGSGSVVTPQPEVAIEWLTPAATGMRINLIDGRVRIQVRISSSTPIELNQIEVLVDGVPTGNKADEVNLMRRPDYADQILSYQVPVNPGEHEVQVVVATAADARYLATRNFIRDASGVRVIDPTPITSKTRVTWVKPDIFVLRDQEMFSTKEREFEIRFNVTSPDPIDIRQLRVLHNKVYQPPSAKAEFRGSNGNYYFRDWVTLDENAPFNEVALRVETVSGRTLSQRLRINFSPVRPNLYLLAVGPSTNLKYSSQDARDIATAFQSQGSRAFRLFNRVAVDTLIGKAATTQAIRLAIASIKNKLRTGVILEDDIVVLFFSTHGFLLDGQLHLQADDYSTYAPAETSIPYREGILAKVDELPCKKLIFIDACHSGGARANVADVNRALVELREAPRGMAVFSSSRDREESYEDAAWKNGAFTEAILQGLLQGHADRPGYGNNNGIVSLNELEKYVQSTVPILVRTVKAREQNPTLTRNDLGDLPLFIHQ